jgi:hypothetical protein
MHIQNVPHLVTGLRAVIESNPALFIHINPNQPSRFHFDAFHIDQFHTLSLKNRFGKLSDCFSVSLYRFNHDDRTPL